MKKFLFLSILFAVPCFAEGPRYRHIEPEKQLEFENVYRDLRGKLSLTNLLSSTNTWTAQQSFSTSTLFGDGSLSAPGISFILDTNTGVRRRAADDMRAVAGGVDVMAWTPTQTVSMLPGSNAAPAYTWSDGNIGLSNPSSNVMTGSVAGVAISSWTTTGFSAKGTTTNDDAPAGWIGQYLSSACTTSLTVRNSAQYYDVCYSATLTLTPGDWDVNGTCFFLRNGATYTGTGVECGIGTATGNDASGIINADTNSLQDNATGTGWSDVILVTPTVRKSVSVNTTIFLKGYPGTFTGSPTSRGRISARRMR